MNKYNLEYKTPKKIIRLRNISEKDLIKFLSTLKKEEKSYLYVKRVKEIEKSKDIEWGER